jgi:GT2 family glycosyltransferase
VSRGEKLGVYSRILTAKGKLVGVWGNSELTVLYKLNWTVRHSFRLFWISLKILRMIIDNPSSAKRIFGPRLLNTVPSYPTKGLRHISFRDFFFTKWFSYLPHYSLTQPAPSDNLDGNQITVVVPVYGQIEVVRNLLTQLRAEQESLSFRLLVIDDCFDEHTSLSLRAYMLGWPNTELVVNPKNLGFLESVNRAVSSLETRFVVLLNSDVEITPGSIARLVQPVMRQEVALATALATDSGNNLTLSIPQGRHWIEVDGWLRVIKPEYPDAHTAIGYALGIDLSCVNKKELFSRDYKDGYGEDSDLHFQVIQNGFRSVIVDNLLVRHHSGISYQTKANLKKIQNKNMRVFKDKWGDSYKNGIRKWEKTNSVNRIRGFVDRMNRSQPLDADCLVLIPSVGDASGGGRMVVSLFEELWRSGFTARISSTIKEISTEYSWTPIPERKIPGSKISKVIATGSGTFAKSEMLSAKLNAEEVLFFQGPEMFFDNGSSFGSTIHTLNRVDRVISVSPYLANLATTFGATDVSEVPLGPDTHLFFRDESIKKQKRVLISSRRNFDKGSVFSTPLALHFLALGYSVETFGPTSDALRTIKGLKHHGQLSANDLNRLFNESSFMVDTSIFEGLGLAPLECLRAGCIPITNRKGGLESIGIPEGWVLWLDTPFVSQEALGLAIENYEALLNRDIQALENFFMRRNLTKGISQASRLISNRGHPSEEILL